MLRCVSLCSVVSDWTIRGSAHDIVSEAGPARRLNGRHKHLGERFSHPVQQAAVHEAQCFEAQSKTEAQSSLRHGLKKMQGLEEGYLKEAGKLGG